MRVCNAPGCPALVPAGTRGGRCPEHRRQVEQARGTRQQRGYDAAYDRRRRADLDRMSAGAILECWRCERVVMPHEYSLGHCDDDRSVIHGPEHLACNLANTRGDCSHASHM